MKEEKHLVFDKRNSRRAKNTLRRLYFQWCLHWPLVLAPDVAKEANSGTQPADARNPINCGRVCCPYIMFELTDAF